MSTARRTAATLLLLAAATRPAVGQMCPDGSPPPCRAAAARTAAPPPAPGSRLRPYTIMAEFDGTAPPVVRAAAKNLVVSALDESSLLAVLPEDQLRLGLTLAGKPATTRLDVATARELAVRGSVRTVLTGSIDQVGQTYHAAVRLLSADSGVVVASGRGMARGEDDLIPTLDRVVRAVRVSLRERRGEIAANRPLEQAATPSFAAYQRYLRARELTYGTDQLGARAAYKEALALDSGFAAAWRGLYVTYNNLGFYDSARSALKEALARRDRLTEPQRLQVEIAQVCSLGDRWACLAAFEQAKRLSGGYQPNVVNVLSNLGRDSEVVAILEDLQRSSPFGLSPAARQGLAEGLLPLGRFEEARRIAETLTGDLRTRVRLEVAAWTADWPATDSLAKRLLELAPIPRVRVQAAWALASVAAARGSVQKALGTLEDCCPFEQLMLRIVSGSPVTGAPFGTSPPDTSVGGQLFEAMWFAAAGDTGAARRIVTRVQGLPPERRGSDEQVGFADAWVGAAEGRPAEVVRLVRPLADVRKSGLPWFSQPAQWLLAVAYERLGQLDSAAAQLELLATWQGSRGAFGKKRGLTHSFAHQRLVLLYASLGRPADAWRHWQVFTTTFTDPDPEMQHFVDEARAALAGVERGGEGN